MSIELSKRNISVDTDSLACSDGHSIGLNFDTWFNVKEKFGVRLKEDEYLILAAAYDPFEDTLRIGYDVGDINDSEQYGYQPTEAEAQAVKELIAETIRDHFNMSPREFCEQAGVEHCKPSGDNEFRRGDINVDGDIQISDDGSSLTVCLETWFDAGKKFNVDLNADDAWLNMYATYNPFADTLEMAYTVGTDTFTSTNDYDPTDNEARLVKAMIAEHIRNEHGQTPQEFCREAMNENHMEMGGQT